MEETSLHLVCILGRIRPNWFGHQHGNRANWFAIELIWFEIGLIFQTFSLELVWQGETSQTSANQT